MAATIVAAQGANDGPEEEVTLYRTVAIDYSNPDYPADEFAKLLKNSPPVQVNVAPNQTVSKILQSQFGLSATRTPQLYGKAVREIMELNDLADPDRILTGRPLLIPGAPRSRSKEKQVQGNAFYAIPRLSGNVRNMGMAWNAEFNALVGTPYVDDTNRKAVQYELQFFTLPKSVALRYAIAANDDQEKAQREGKAFSLNERLTMRLAGMGSCAPVPVLDQNGRDALKDALKGPLGNKPLLIILDDAWPDDAEFQKAMKFIADASETIRKYFRMEEDFQVDPMQVRKQLMYPTTTSFGSAKPYPKCQFHSAMIKASLAEFVALDEFGAVEIIYLPANVAQGGAEAAYKEILYVSLLATAQGRSLNQRIPVPNVTILKESAKQVVKYPHLAGPLIPYSKNAPSRTDKAILDAVALFLELYSQATMRPHLLSLSWTTEDLTLPVTWREAGYGLKLAAVGNDKGRDIFAEPPLQFAARSVSPGNLLAVENGDQSGLLCDSNRVPTDVDAFGLTFPGHVDADVCGSSFSAPRVAWLLALRRAAAKPIENDKALRAWPGLERKRLGALLTAARRSQGPSFLRVELLVQP